MTLDDLLALAEQATPGPWDTDIDIFDDRLLLEACVFDKDHLLLATLQSELVNDPTDPAVMERFKASQERKDARYIAACSPEVIKALVAVAKATTGITVMGQHTGRVGGPEPKYPEDFTHYVQGVPEVRAALDALRAVLA